MNPLASILVVTYNQRDYLKECIDSCIGQTYRPIEIIVADDASNDGTHELLNEYKIKYPEIVKLNISKENGGITKNSNAGLKECRGDYIALIGGDDLMHPDKMQTLIEYMRGNEKCTVCYHDMDVFESKSNTSLHLYGRKNNSTSGDLTTVLRYGSINCSSASVYLKRAIPAYGFRTELEVASDWMFTIDALSNGGEIIYLPIVLGRYRRHHGNVTNNESPLRSRAMYDLVLTCSISLTQFPNYSFLIIKRLGMILRESRFLDNSKFYEQRMRASIISGGGYKSVIGFCLFKITMGKIKI